MVVRREGERLRSYVHVGTGNYNARSGREYTDFSLFSARDDLVQDATDLFNALTGGTLPPRGLSRGSLVAPHQMADSLIGFIDREAANARAGLQSGIILKVNGLSDSDVILALLRAAGDGVRVDIICRGICTLRPGIAGVSANVRVVSNVGRFLEHSRAYRFENGGDPVHFIGSADLRQRNLRRRVELLVPVTDTAQKVEVDRILRAYLDDRAAWELRDDGAYVQRRGGPSDAQMLMMG
jgi:polyphosphate kinase